MKTRIVTDSTCDLPAESLEALGIGVVPNYINIGESSYLDGTEMTHQEFYEKLESFSSHTKTSSPGSGLFETVYSRLAEEGARHIISLHIHSGLSNLSNAARIAARSVRNVQVTVMEVGQVARGLGFIVLSAAEAAMNGQPAEDIIKLIRDQDRRTVTYAVLDTVEYLKKSGRAPSLLVGIANLLRIKPIIQLHEGALKLAGQVRTSSRAIEWLISHMRGPEGVEKLAVLHTNALGLAEKLRDNIQAVFPSLGTIVISEATPALGVHVGPHALGLVFVRSRSSEV